MQFKLLARIMCGKKIGAVSGDHFTGHIAQKLSLGLAYYVCVDSHFCSLAVVTTEYPVLSKYSSAK